VEKAGVGGSFFATGFCAQADAVINRPKTVNAQMPRNMGNPPW
jgi:hypothetical protein